MNKLTAVLLGLLAVPVAGVAHAQAGGEIDADYVAKSNNWRFNVSPYALLASQSTDVGGQRIRQSFGDLSSLTNFGFQLAATAMYGNWLLTADGTFANLGASGDKGPLQVDLDIQQYMLDTRLGYLVLNRVDHDDASGVVRGWALEVNAGAKYWRNELTVDYSFVLGGPPPLLEGREGSVQDWWDPMIGARARIILSRTVLLGLHASGGGFGIGNASDAAYDLMYTNTFKVSRLVLVTAGFRAFHYDRTDGEGDDALETRVSVVGPLLGVSFVF